MKFFQFKVSLALKCYGCEGVNDFEFKWSGGFLFCFVFFVLFFFFNFQGNLKGNKIFQSFKPPGTTIQC